MSSSGAGMTHGCRLCPGGAASTIVDCTGDVPRILREGCIPAAAVASAAAAGA